MCSGQVGSLMANPTKKSQNRPDKGISSPAEASMVASVESSAMLKVLGIVLAAGYILWMMERTFFGERRERFADLTDASLVEAAPLALMVVTIIGVGVWPSLLTDVFESGLNPMVDVLNGVINK